MIRIVDIDDSYETLWLSHTLYLVNNSIRGRGQRIDESRY